MKNNKGITIIALIITIVVMIIIAGITIYYGAAVNVDNTSAARAYNELLEVSEAVSQRNLMNGINSEKYKFIGLALSDSNYKEINGNKYGDGWYELKVSDTPELELENIRNDYVVNYKTGEVISYIPVYYKDNEYYSSLDLRNAMGGGTDVVSEDMYNSKKGVNKPYLVNGMIPVRNENGTWFITNADDDRWYDYSQEGQTWANVMLKDEIEVKGYSNEEVRTATLAELDGLEVTTNGSMFVWIPRYTSNAAGEIMYSYLTDDYLQEGFSVSPAFTDNTGELTGIWISKYDAEYK